MRDLTVRQLEEYLLDHYQQSRTEEGLFIKLVEEVGEVAEVLNGRSGRKMEEKSLELEKQVPGFQLSVNITAEDFDSSFLADNIPVFVFCQAYREKEYRNSEYWNSNTKLILGGNHHYLHWSESEKIATLIREL